MYVCMYAYICMHTYAYLEIHRHILSQAHSRTYNCRCTHVSHMTKICLQNTYRKIHKIKTELCKVIRRFRGSPGLTVNMSVFESNVRVYSIKALCCAISSKHAWSNSSFGHVCVHKHEWQYALITRRGCICTQHTHTTHSGTHIEGACSRACGPLRCVITAV